MANKEEQDRLRTEEEVNTAKRARMLGARYTDSRVIVPNVKLIPDILSVEEMYKLQIAPIARDKGRLTFAIAINTPQKVLREMKKRFSDFNISYVLISDSGMRELMERYNPPKKVIYQDVEIASEGQSSTLESVSKTLETVRSDDILNYLITQAERQGASDIHLEVEREYIRMRFRIDGALHAIAKLSPEKYRSLSSSIAVAADIATEAPVPQTGHITYEVKRADGTMKKLNMRIETTPTLYGQDAVIRLFNFDRSLLTLESLGLGNNHMHMLEEIVEHPHGMVMVVGPTGSGKTTTLYSLLDKLNDPTRKIITLEDPIEYDFEGVSQIPVASRKDQSFADRLRAVLRLDPDVIMVGEIRDVDTARTALQASLTGHLVLTTFHAASASAALARMMETIGENPLFMSSLNLVIGQRLVRVLDENKQAYSPEDYISRDIKNTISSLPDNYKKPTLDQITLYKPKASEDSPFGFKGRQVISEFLKMTPEMQNLLKEGGMKMTAQNIEDLAVKQGMVTMKQDGIFKALSGVTSIDEVYKAVA
jgi:type II secretory ATPase GspE/PulE/Tfp pilus assembly ATPase PilB-like protein